MVISKIKQFLHLEAAGGIIVLIAAVLAMVAKNSPLSIWYDSFLQLPVAIQFADFKIAKPLLLWINDGLMAIFFFLIGLEVKREVLAGELSEPSRVVLPTIAALGGMFVPALIYAYINWGNAVTINGWAIPSATDIAFALGVLALLGSRIPQSLKLFLMTLAIIDDLGAIIIIALFYTSKLSITSLMVAGFAVLVLFLLNNRKVISTTPYILVSIILWAAVLKSGVHATLAGVVAALFIPYKKAEGETQTQLEQLEHDLHPTVAFAILPLFAFANAGISFSGLSLSSLTETVPLGIALGLFFGNQIGVFGLSWLAIKLKLCKLPQGVSWVQLYGASCLCGIGFTMSLFISSLAFEDVYSTMVLNDKLGILLGSLLSGILGYCILKFTSSKTAS